jgi:hypothetical protein
MNIKKFMSKTAIVAVSIGLAAVSAHAAKPSDPPKDSGRLVIAEATEICVVHHSTLGPALGDYPTDGEIRGAACDLLFKTDGTRGGDRCAADSIGNGYVEYALRNCDKNEAAQQRKAASVVLSMDDVVVRGKDQKMTAAMYACDYASKADFLEDVSKLTYLEKDGVFADLAGDADSIAAALGYGGYASCEELLLEL